MTYAYKFENLDEMDIFLERLKLQKLTQGKIDKFHGPIFIKDMNLCLKTFL